MYTKNMGGLIIAPECFGDTAFLTEVKPYYVYADNQRTDKVAGYKYVVVFPARRYQFVDVKVPGKNRLEGVSDALMVRFVGLTIKTYCDDKDQVRLTAKADDVQVIAP